MKLMRVVDGVGKDVNIIRQALAGVPFRFASFRSNISPFFVACEAADYLLTGYRFTVKKSITLSALAGTPGYPLCILMITGLLDLLAIRSIEFPREGA